MHEPDKNVAASLAGADAEADYTCSSQNDQASVRSIAAG